MRTIGMFAPDLQGGGAERVIVRLANAFVSMGYEVDLMLLHALGPNMRLVASGVHVTNLNSRWRNAIPSLITHLRHHRPDVVLAVYDEWCTFPLVACKVCGVPFIATIHTDMTALSSHESWTHRGIRWAARLFLCRADAIVAVAPAMRDDLIRWAKIPSEKLHVLPNPIVTPDLVSAAAEPAEHPWFGAGEKPVLIAVGRLAPVKRFDVLLRSFAKVRDDTDARLVVVGEGPERGMLESLARTLDIERDVALLGWRDNPYALMSRACALVLSSDVEGLPSVVIEALAVGTPVIATDCSSGTREALRDGELGSLVPVGSEDALADAMRAALMRRLSAPAGAQAWVLARYGVDAAARRYEEVLLQICEHATAARRA